MKDNKLEYTITNEHPYKKELKQKLFSEYGDNLGNKNIKFTMEIME